jgi:hypothetical protein
MDYAVRNDVYEVAQNMREALGLRARLACDWPECSVRTDGSQSLQDLLLMGWSSDLQGCRSVDFCPEHAKRFGGRQWARVEQDLWINIFDEYISLVQHDPSEFTIEFGGRGSGATLARSNDHGALVKLLESDESIQELFDNRSKNFSNRESEMSDSDIPF